MARQQTDGSDKAPKKVRKSLLIEADKLAKARKALGVASDAEVLRVALDHLLSHFEEHHAKGTAIHEEEE